MKRCLLFTIIVLLESSCITLPNINTNYGNLLGKTKKTLFTLPLHKKVDPILNYPEPLYTFVSKLSKDYSSVNPILIYSIIEVESNWNNSAININNNGTYDIGLAQINSAYLNYYCERFVRDLDPCVPEDAIKLCFVYMEWLINYFDGDTDKAIMAYNIGCGSVSRGDKLEIGNNYLEKVNYIVDSLS